MPSSKAQTIDYTAWAKRANARWIVHGGLGKNAEAYMAHLERCDPTRLDLSCRNAYLMVWQRDSMEDPKPWFYGGLFSLATAEEAAKFTSEHWLTNLLVGPNQETALSKLTPEVGDLTLEKIESLRGAMAKLPDPS